ncbi:MAG TPA: DUF2071 domain-containing protein [Humisphaera sp.]|nr:DUF2071 domain-containing protein [Humisphaera sp.]
MKTDLIQSPRPFLTAQWRHIAMLNFEVDPQLLTARVPRGTELDSWNGRTFVSMVGFRFLDTRVRNIAVPFHRDFEEVNLRFYVRHGAVDGWRRGVVFIKELVPRAAIAWVARNLYNEPYLALPMSHAIRESEGQSHVEYSWRYRKRRHALSVQTQGPAQEIIDGSEEEFIAEHYWGYTAQRDGGTLEYKVEHPRWRVSQVAQSNFDCDVAALYGDCFRESISGRPSSAFLAEGSAVTVYSGRRIDF